MRLLIVNKLYAPWIGGVERVVQDTAEGLKDDFAMMVLCCQPKGAGSEELLNGVRVVRAGSFGMLWGMPVSFDFFRKFGTLVKNHDIIHIHLPFPLAAIAFVFFRAQFKEKALVVTYHSDIVRQRILNPILFPFVRALLRAAAVIITSSPILSERSSTLKPFAGKIRTIPFGINLSEYVVTPVVSAAVQEVRHRYALPLILFAGRLNYYKGVEYLLKAAKNVAGTFIIAGEGPERRRLEEIAEKTGIASKVAFMGRLSDYELKVFFHAADIFVFPSTESSEAFGLVQLQAMACGKPVVNTALPTGVPWVSVHNETSLTVPPKDVLALATALSKLLQDDTLRKRFGENAKRRVEAYFTLQRMVEEHKLIYSQLLEVEFPTN